MRQILETWSVTRKNFGILVSSVRLQREVPGQTVVMAMLVIIMFFMLICMLTMLMIMVLVVKGTFKRLQSECVPAER